VAIRKGQQDSSNPANAHVGTIKVPSSPITTGLPAGTKKSNEDGPSFDFGHPEVASKAAELRASVAALKAICERSGAPPAHAEGYPALRAELEAVMPVFYAGYDAYVAAVLRTGESAPSCSRGCSHCCSHYVASVEPFELIFLHGRIAGGDAYPNQVIGLHRRTTLFHSLRRADEGDLAEDKALYRYYLRGTPCPFLGPAGACGVYESRPMSCRMFFSLSDPAFCKGRAVVDPRNRNFLIELPEDIEADLSRAGAALSAYGLPEFLFEGLLEANGAFGRFEADPPGN
jgi:Fe-S-cluster containining protein